MNKADIKKSTGNVFADLELDDADSMLAKAELASIILDIIEKRRLTQNQAAKLLGTDQSYISKLRKGSELHKFTYDRLYNWLNKLDHSVVIRVKKISTNQNHGTVETVHAMGS
ncbi:MAG: helix-turn-helix domain-containing protein [Thermodesulfobacteriota bacterium]